MTPPLLEVVDLVKVYRLARPSWFAPHPFRRAVDGVGLVIEAGRSFGVVGESGSGKSTLARAVMALERPTSGVVRLEGRPLAELPRRELRAMRAHIQMIFQDPYGSLDPRQKVARVVAEPLSNLAHVRRAERASHVEEALRAVGLGPADAQKYPHEFSGGQRQRIAIARALITRPKLVVADEPVSALDVSIQAQVLNLMSDLQREAGVTYLLISHDLAVVGYICDEIAVMFQGRFVETGPSAALLKRPAHPYTRELVDAEPKLEQAPPPPPEPPPRPDATTGCPYAARCLFAQARCVEEAPTLRSLGEGRRVACHFPLGG
jgi:peptide/nickel transport system ATP-binding protein